MDISAANWNETDDNNSVAAPDGAPEGMLPSGLNNTVRAVMGAMKRWFNWSIPKITGGTATAYTLTYGVSPGALVDGMTHLVQFHAANGTSATLNVNALGAIPLYYHSSAIWRPAVPGLFDADEIFRVAYHAGSATYRILRPGADKTGVVKSFAGPTVPGGYLLCYGQAVSRTAYSGLFNTIGTAFGTGDGSTTFNLPDLRGRPVAGKDDMGGSAANRITSTTVPNSPNLGAVGGAQTVVATGSTGGSLTATVDGTSSLPTDFQEVQAGTGAVVASLNHQHATHSVGSTSGTLPFTSSAFSVVQPTIILNQMIAI